MDKYYRAFISYKHGLGLPFADRIAKSLRLYGRYTISPPLRIFRDEEYLLPNANLPNAIKTALDRSDFLILIASPASVKSVWVEDELRIWCQELKRKDKLIVVLVEGEIAFSLTSKDIDWTNTTALPNMLQQYFSQIPLYVDLRWVVNEKHLDLTNPEFRNAINRIAAAINNIDPEQMLNTEVKVHRRNILIFRGAIFLLLAFGAVAGTGFIVASKSLNSEKLARSRAESETQNANASLIATRARQVSSESPQLAILLAAEAVNRLRSKNEEITTPAAQALLDIFHDISGTGLRGHRTEPRQNQYESGADMIIGTYITAVAISPDSKWIATGDNDGRVILRSRDKLGTWTELLHGTPSSSLLRDKRWEHGIMDLAFSKDSNHLAVSTLQSLLLCDVSTCNQLAHLDYLPITRVRFVGKDHWLATTGPTINLYDTSKTPSPRVILSDSYSAQNFVVAANGELLVSDRGDVWNWRDNILTEHLLPKGFNTSALAIAPDGYTLAFGNDDGELQLVDVKTKSRMTLRLKGSVKSLAFSQDSKLVAAASGKTVYVFDTVRHQQDALEHVSEIVAVAFSRDRSIVSLCDDGSLRRWPKPSHYPDKDPMWQPYDLKGLNISGIAMTVSQDGSIILAGGYDPVPRLWLSDEWAPGLEVFFNSSENNSYFTVDAVGSTVAIGTESGPLVFKARESGWEQVRLPKAEGRPKYQVITVGEEGMSHQETIIAPGEVVISPNGRWVAQQSFLDSALWDIASPSARPRIILDGSARHRYVDDHVHDTIRFSHDSSLVGIIQTETDDVLLEFIDGANRSPIILPSEANQIATDFAFDPNGQRVAVAYLNGSISVWDLQGKKRTQVSGGSPPRPDAWRLSFSPDGKRLVVVGSKFLDWIDTENYSLVKRLQVPTELEPTELSLAPNATFVAVGTKTGSTLVWEATTGALHILNGLRGTIEAVVFSPDSKLIASIAENGVRIWSAEALAMPPLQLSLDNIAPLYEVSKNTHTYIDGFAPTFSSGMFLQGGNFIATAKAGGAVLWNLNWDHLADLACRTAGRNIRAEEANAYLDGSAAISCHPGSR